MDDLRRKFLLGSTALVGGILLPGCGGGDASPASTTDNDERAAAQSVVPTSVGASFLKFSRTSLSPALDGIFTEPNMVAMTPAANLTQAVYSQSPRTLHVRLMEVLTGSDGAIHHRSFQVSLFGFDPSVASAQSFSSPDSPDVGYRGSFVDMVLKNGALSRYEYGIDVSQEMGIVYAYALPSNRVRLCLLSSIGVPKATNLFSSPQDPIALESGSNGAVNTVAMTTRVIRNDGTSAASGIELNYGVESGSWI